MEWEPAEAKELKGLATASLESLFSALDWIRREIKLARAWLSDRTVQVGKISFENRYDIICDNGFKSFLVKSAGEGV